MAHDKKEKKEKGGQQQRRKQGRAKRKKTLGMKRCWEVISWAFQRNLEK